MKQRRKQFAVIGMALILLVAAVGIAPGQDTAPAAKRGDDMAKAAEKAKEAPKDFWGALWAYWGTLYELGGKTMIALAFFSILGLASVLERGIGLLFAWLSIAGPLQPARRLWAQGRFDEVEQLVARKTGITARLIHFIVRHRDCHVSDVRDGVSDIASRFVRRHVRRNYWLAFVAAVSPLLGLLGTIWGMIEAFEKVNIAGSMGSAEYLSGAISKALITTAGGLTIAIPALFFYHIYKSLTGVLADTLEGKANEMANGWLMRRGAVRGEPDPSDEVQAAGAVTDLGMQQGGGE
jgi:biopolymer transport protein ExbB